MGVKMDSDLKLKIIKAIIQESIKNDISKNVSFEYILKIIN